MTAPRLAAQALTALLAVTTACSALAQDTPLPPDEVFRYTARADAERVYVDFDILDSYYLYRTRFGFDSGTNGVALGAARFPRGETHSDEFFGEQEIYRRQFQVSIPYRRSAAVTSFDLKLELQGCAPTFCYLPQDWTAAVTLPPVPFLGAGAIDTSATGDLLPVDDAFTMNARFDKPNELTVAWQVAPNYYLYRDKLTFAVTGRIDLGAPNMPAGTPHTDDSFGDVEVFRDYVEVKLPFARASPDEIEVELTAGFQGCKDGSICYPPGEQVMALVLPATSEFPASQAPAASADGELVSEQDQWLARIVNGSWWTLLGGFYVAGLLLSMTGCVLPMVPIVSSIIVGHGPTTSMRSFLLSLSYVLGMAVTYTAAGAIAGLVGGQVQAIFQEPWIITLFAALFVGLALGMFGVYDLAMPSAIQTRVSNLANRQQGGTYVGTAMIGALTSLIVTACVAPALVAALTAISQTGDVARGAGALFAASIGMGTPLLLVGASAGFLLPRVGPWMNTVKAAFGVVMLGVAIWLLERILPDAVGLTLWALLVFMTGVFLGAFEPLPASPTPIRRLAKGLGVLACLYGALLVIGATLGGSDPLRPFPQGATGRVSTGGVLAAQAQDGLEFRAIETVAELDAALGEAQAAKQPVMLDFSAEWCVACREMEEYTFPDPGVIGALKPFMLLRADVTDNNDDDQALLKRVRSFGPPTIAFFDKAGTERENFKLVGFVPATEFRDHALRLAAL